MKKIIKIKPLMNRIVHNGDVVYSKTGSGYYKVLAAYGDDGTPGCMLRDSVHVFVPNEVITDQEATMIMSKPAWQISDLDLRQWLQWRYAKFRWDTPAHYDIARYKNEYCYNYDVDIDGFSEYKHIYGINQSMSRKQCRDDKKVKNWYVELHQ